MSVLVVGSIAIDSVQTPCGEAREALGGSAAYFAYAASYFSPVRMVGVVGEDFPTEYLSILQQRAYIDTKGIMVQAGGKSFRWKGRYTGDMNSAETLEVHLNVFGSFDPQVPAEYQDSPYLFLANGGPNVQHQVLRQMQQTGRPKLVVADTMNLWIETARDELLALMREIDGLVLNDSEARLLTDEASPVAAGVKILDMGPKFVIIKKGEHGAMFFSKEGLCAFPAYPTRNLVDPTGAGDSFAGGLMGYLASHNDFSIDTIKKAMAFGTVMASINVEGFSLSRFLTTTEEQIAERYELYREMLRLD